MILLGIDPGYERLGFGAIQKDEKGLVFLDAGVIETKRTISHPARLAVIYHELRALIRRLNPDRIAVERLFFTSNQKTLVPVAEARGVILLTSALSNHIVYEYTPPEVKLAVTGSGKADKKAVSKMIMLTLRLDAAPWHDDATDAIALAITAAYDRKNDFSESGRN